MAQDKEDIILYIYKKINLYKKNIINIKTLLIVKKVLYPKLIKK